MALLCLSLQRRAGQPPGPRAALAHGAIFVLLAFVVMGCNTLPNEQAVQLLSSLPSTPRAVLSALEKNRNDQIALQANALFTNLVAQEQFSGSVLIAKNGRILLDKGYGMANWQDSTPDMPRTRFYLGSVTKEFTAIAILILQERGKLNVKNSICTYVTPCPSAWQPVTLHDVLTHTSGIPELDTSQFSDTSPADWIASYNNVGLDFTPGSQFDYCSVCYEILAYVVQQVSGLPYSHFMQQAIFTPLHMKHTGFSSDVYYAQPEHAEGYGSWQVDSGQLGYGDGGQFSDLGPWSFLCGSGLLTSTVEDLYLWDQALYTTRLLSQRTLNEAFTSYTDGSLFAGSTYGYGWFLTPSPVPGHRLVWHDGVIDGFRTYIGRYVDDHVTILFLSNLATVDSPTLAQSVQKIVFS